MKQRYNWQKILNVREDEQGIVRKLFFLQFFQGAGIAFFLTASLTLLLEQFQITQIPYVFIFSAFLLWISGFAYSKLEHNYPLNKVAFIITIFMIASILFFRLTFVFWHSSSFIFLMLPWFYVLYLLNNLEFWGIASLIFDARQSKRLFSVISAGDIPAKMIGYTIAGFTVKYIGTINLLWAALFCMLASIPFLITVHEAKIIDEHHHLHKKHNSHVKKNIKPHHNIEKLIENFFGNDLIRKVALLGILMSMSFLIINFSFWAKVKNAFHDDISLANFIAFFNAIISIVFMIFKLGLTSRLINRIGIIKSLLITPIVLTGMIGLVIYSEGMNNHSMILYFFGITYSIVDTLKTSINNPVFLTVMQPLPNHERLRAHMILKGIMDPFAFLFTGTSILLLIKIQGKVDLVAISYSILVICIFWIAGVYALNKQYLKTIISSISNKFFNLDNLSIHDRDTLLWLKNKAKSGTETEVLNIISMLKQQSFNINDELIISLFEHPSEKVKLSVLNLMLEKDYPIAAKSLLAKFHTDLHPSILAITIKVICKHKFQPEWLLDFLKNEDHQIRYAAIDGLYFYAHGEAREKAAAMLTEMSKSQDVEQRMAAAQILSNHYHIKETEMVLALMKDEDIKVRKLACFAAGKSTNEILIKGLIDLLDNHETEVIEPLLLGGDNSLQHIKQYVLKESLNPYKREKLISLIGRINTVTAYQMLLELLDTFPEYNQSIIKALYRSGFLPNQKEKEILIAVSRKLLARCAGIVYLQNGLMINKAKNDLLINALKIELETLRETILNIFAISSSKSNFNKVKKAYSVGDKSSIINAMEIIDITMKKEIAYRFNTIFEPGEVLNRITELEKLYEPVIYTNPGEVITSILSEDKTYFNNWTISCAIYASKAEGIDIETQLIHKFMQSENPLLRETANLKTKERTDSN